MIMSFVKQLIFQAVAHSHAACTCVWSFRALFDLLLEDMLNLAVH